MTIEKIIIVFIDATEIPDCKPITSDKNGKNDKAVKWGRFGGLSSFEPATTRKPSRRLQRLFASIKLIQFALIHLKYLNPGRFCL